MTALTAADQISDIAFGFMGSKALFAALGAGVFSALAEGPMTPADLARVTPLEADRTGPKLAALSQLQHTAFTPRARSLDEAGLAEALSGAGFDKVGICPMIPEMTMLAQAVKPG